MGSIASSVSAISSVSTTTNSETVLLRATFNGLNGAGAISVPGLLVGDILMRLQDGGGSVNFGGSFIEPVVTVNGEIQQTSSADFSSNSYSAVFVRGL